MEKSSQKGLGDLLIHESSISKSDLPDEPYGQSLNIGEPTQGFLERAEGSTALSRNFYSTGAVNTTPEVYFLFSKKKKK